MKENLKNIFYNYYLMIAISLHIFSFGFIILVPIGLLTEGRLFLAITSAILIYPGTLFLFIAAFTKED